jgi:gamma-butyrobetaine dioxygenase
MAFLRLSSYSRYLPRTSSHISKRFWSTYTADDSQITLHALKASYPYIWLRDSCQSPQCVHPSTSQKLHRTSDIPLTIRPVTNNGIRITEDGLRINWTDGHESNFSSSFLERHSSPDKLFTFHRDIPVEAWTSASISDTADLFVTYASLKKPSGLLAAITQITKYGLIFVRNVPNRETSNETCELSRLAKIFGDIRPTFYGPMWDVQNVRNSKNIAYTNLDLGLHMDLL